MLPLYKSNEYVMYLNTYQLISTLSLKYGFCYTPQIQVKISVIILLSKMFNY